MHKGVGLIITNKNKTHFFVQQKDENYPVKKWAGCYSFWGGKIENTDNSKLDALKRELVEEIENVIDFESSAINFMKSFEIICDRNFEFHLFELLLEDELFSELQNATIMEGYGVTLTTDEVKNGKWIWCLEKVVDNYLEM